MPVFGDLEQAVMEVLWANPTAMSVRDVQAALGRDRELAYTTVMTVMDRLAKKGQLQRELNGRAWQYRPTYSWAHLASIEIIALLETGPVEQRRAVLDDVRARVE
ncbi:MAG: BlaI/MecI/CopY family transcriptional regulator [Micropruina sp.]|nr:BlaI/MecI/CopY family transcriptional regulator [Micropruina sp.]